MIHISQHLKFLLTFYYSTFADDVMQNCIIDQKSTFSRELVRTLCQGKVLALTQNKFERIFKLSHNFNNSHKIRIELTIML